MENQNTMTLNKETAMRALEYYLNQQAFRPEHTVCVVNVSVSHHAGVGDIKFDVIFEQLKKV